MSVVDTKSAYGTSPVYCQSMSLVGGISYAKPKRKIAAKPIFCLSGRRSLCTTNMGNMHAKKSCAVLMLITATR